MGDIGNEARLLEEIRDRCWDVVVVGTGMGGGVVGYALARLGLTVLFVERGLARSSESWAGTHPEMAPAWSAQTREAMLAAAGRESRPIRDISGRRPKTFTPFVGAGVGGSSALYGMALERFFSCDFAPREYALDAPESTVPDRWPITEVDLAPYYAEAERLFNVHGSPDPLRQPSGSLPPPPPLTVAGSELFDALQRAGMHPYRLPAACEFVPDCRSCQGYLCPMPCKNDSGRIGVETALRSHHARLVDRCEADRLLADADRVKAVECVRDGRRFTIRGKTVVLAAGALRTPALLLRSHSSRWPTGLANRSGLVGRNLMRHLIDLYAIRPLAHEPCDNRRKEIAFNDFYVHDGVKLGSVQSFGRLPPVPMVIADLRARLVGRAGAWMGPAFSAGSRMIRPTVETMVERDVVLAGIIEDRPYTDNRVSLDAKGVALEYRLRDEGRRRVALQRKLILDVLGGHSVRLIKQASNNEMVAHACGTCRFGHDPRTSVLDANNRAHELENLFVVDASFFPSSSGTNPALTIAANALRVANHVAAAHR